MMFLRFNGFDWDTSNLDKCARHGVNHTEVERLFKARKFLSGPDKRHSTEEDRFFAIGRAAKEHRVIFVIFTLRFRPNGILIRPITARYMHKKEVKRYEETLAEIEE